MPTTTTNFNLKKPSPDEFYDVGVQNENMDTIDGVLKTLQDSINSGATEQELALIRQELVSHVADETAHGIGDKSTLLTENKDSIVSALNELFQNASNGKMDIANAITGMGVVASENDTFAILAEKIGQIVSGKKWAQVTATTNSNTKRFIQDDGLNVGLRYIEANGLEFDPSVILCFAYDRAIVMFPNNISTSRGITRIIFGTISNGFSSAQLGADVSNIKGFVLPAGSTSVVSSGVQYTCLCIE